MAHLIVPVLVTSCHFGLLMAPDSIGYFAASGGSFTATTATILSAEWCNNDGTICYQQLGPCPTDECINVWWIATHNEQGEISVTRGAVVLYSVTDLYNHNEQGRWAGPADVNIDGVIDSQDFFDFTSRFFTTGVDYNMSGYVDSQDFFTFVGDFYPPE